MSSLQNTASITICDLVTDVFLGVTDEEKLCAQQVRWQVVIHFATAPVGCSSDNIADTVCYDQIAKLIAELAAAKKYNLLEHLASSAMGQIKQIISAQVTLSVSKSISKKLNVDLAYMATFTLTQ